MPAAYVRGEYVTVAATFKMSEFRQMYPDATPRAPYISGAGYAVSFPRTPATIDGDTLSVTVTSSQPLPNAVHMNGGIGWGLSWGSSGSDGLPITGGGGLLYVTLDKPATETVYHTVIHTSTVAAMWADTPQQVIDRTWEAFKTLDVYTAKPAMGPIAERVTKKLHYYKSWSPLPGFDMAELLRDGDGRCRAWAEFLVETLRVQSIAASIVAVKPIMAPDEGFVIDKWQYSGANSQNADYPHGNVRYADGHIYSKAGGFWHYDWDPTATDVTHATGTGQATGLGRGQGNTIPVAIFADHALVRIGSENKLYDPSYGTGPFDGASQSAALLAWENASVAGFIRIPTGKSLRMPGRVEDVIRPDKLGVLESKFS